jgi:hypothetical protein
MKTACEIDLSDPVPTIAAETDAAKIARLESANAV